MLLICLIDAYLSGNRCTSLAPCRRLLEMFLGKRLCTKILNFFPLQNKQEVYLRAFAGYSEGFALEELERAEARNRHRLQEGFRG